MAKKCIPGVICIENMTLFLLFVILLLLGYMFFSSPRPEKASLESTPPSSSPSPTAIMVLAPPVPPRLGNSNAFLNIGLQDTKDIFNDPYIPPLKRETYSYKQIGILTGGNQLILPLVGRKHINGRDKWNYFTISNTGGINTKLPIRVQGKVCTNEYGCDEIFDGDVVFVEGYNDTFRATIYENNMFSYIPW